MPSPLMQSSIRTLVSRPGWVPLSTVSPTMLVRGFSDASGQHARVSRPGAYRYLPNADEVRKEMLAKCDAESIEDLFSDIPPHLRTNGPADYPNLPLARSEIEIEKIMGAMSDKSLSASKVPFFVGCGLYKHHIPSVVDHLVQRSEFLTSYTPYQPEVSQGTLQSMFEFQTQVARLSGLEVANASMYDGATALAEAALMASRVTRRRKVIISGSINPRYSSTVDTYAKHSGAFDIQLMAPDIFGKEDILSLIDSDTAAVLVQNPSVFGYTKDYSSIAEACHSAGALLCFSVTEAVSLGALKSPGSMGADIFVGEGQSFGNMLNFGGPTVGLFSCKNKFVRQMPGRLVGETEDADGKRSYVLTLATREQHIRRQKATSNICTSAGLCALAFTVHVSLLGEIGLRHLADLNHARACEFADRVTSLESQGVRLLNDTFFNEMTLELPSGTSATEVIERMSTEDQVLGGVSVGTLFGRRDLTKFGVDDRYMILAVTETTTSDDMDKLISSLSSKLKK